MSFIPPEFLPPEVVGFLLSGHGAVFSCLRFLCLKELPFPEGVFAAQMGVSFPRLSWPYLFLLLGSYFSLGECIETFPPVLGSCVFLSKLGFFFGSSPPIPGFSPV